MAFGRRLVLGCLQMMIESSNFILNWILVNRVMIMVFLWFVNFFFVHNFFIVLIWNIFCRVAVEGFLLHKLLEFLLLGAGLLWCHVFALSLSNIWIWYVSFFWRENNVFLGSDLFTHSCVCLLWKREWGLMKLNMEDMLTQNILWSWEHLPHDCCPKTKNKNFYCKEIWKWFFFSNPRSFSVWSNFIFSQKKKIHQTSNRVIQPNSPWNFKCSKKVSCLDQQHFSGVNLAQQHPLKSGTQNWTIIQI